jgi:hypothetical protein
VERTYVFAADLIEAGRIPGFGGLRWRPFVRRDDVKAELARLGYELCEDGANHDPRLRVFFAVELKEAS